jgi:hypothetical protein
MKSKELRHKGMDWIELVQDRVQWQALVYIIVSIKGMEFLYELCHCQLQNYYAALS